MAIETAPQAPGGFLAGFARDPSAAATAALTVLTIAGAFGFARMFSTGPFLWPIGIAAVAAHGVAFWCRRNELPTLPAAVATIGTAALTGAWTVLGHATAYGVPIPYTMRAGIEELDRARAAFEVVRAPTPMMAGFLVALVLAVGVVAFMADWAAFRLSTAAEAVVPSFTLLVFTSVLAHGRGEIVAFASFTGSAIVFLGLHSVATRGRTAWFGGRPAAGTFAVVRVAAVLGAIAITAGAFIWQTGPLTDADAVVKLTGRAEAGPSSRSTLSPLVDIRGRLADRRDTEVFTVTSNEPAYWRLTSLDRFNGSIWSSNATYRPTRGGLGTAEPLVEGVPSYRLTQEYRIRALGTIWLPAAFRPQRVTGISGVSYNSTSVSLITDEDTTDGYTYTIESAKPKLAPDQLRGAPAQAPLDIARTYLQLPAIDGRVKELARTIIRDKSTPFDRALALQNYFIDNFTYDLNALQGHSSEALVNFLFRNKRGYCEQFAGAYAVLAREVGLPARVAVGFTPGDLTPDGHRIVRELHAHAWPEVYLHGFGWVSFEPTPQRGDPLTESYTGRPAAQDTSDGQAAVTTVPPLQTTLPDDVTPSSVAPTPEAPENRPDSSQRRGLVGIYLWLAVIGGAGALYCVTVPLLHWQRIRVRRAAVANVEKVLAAWAEATEVLALAGVRRRPSETMTEFAARAPMSAGFQPEAASALRTLSRDASVAAYAGEGGTVVLDDAVGARAKDSARSVTAAVSSQVTALQRLMWWLDPRPLLRDRSNEL